MKKSYTDKQLHKHQQMRYELGINEGRRLQREEDSKNNQTVKLQSIHNRYEHINKLLSMAGQYQETITRLVQAAEKQL